MPVPFKVEEQIADLYKRIAEQERRQQNAKRTGTVHEVDAKKGLARVMLKERGDDDQPYLTGWLPWGEISAGAIKTHFPPSKGQQVKVVSESGDLSDAEIDMSLPSNDNPRPHDKEAEGVITVGDTRIQFTAGEVHITSPKIVFEGAIEIRGDVTQEGSLTSTGAHTAAAHV